MKFSGARRRFLGRTSRYFGAAATLTVQGGFATLLHTPGEVHAEVTCGLPTSEFHPVDLRAVGINLAFYGGFGGGAPTPALIRTIAAMGVGHVRWPGGELANYWDWRRNQPKPYPGYPHWGEKGLKIEDLAWLAGRGIMPILILNMLTDTLESQMAMLEYLDAAGVPIGKIELGNEFYLTAKEKPDYAVAFPKPESYASKAALWADVIRAKFPGVEIAAVASSRGDQAARCWNSAISVQAKHFDAVSLHGYARLSDEKPIRLPRSLEPMELQQTEARRLMLPTGLDDEVSIFEHNLYKFLNAAFVNLPQIEAVWFTELNKAPMLSYVNGTWLHGLFVATMFLALFSRPEVRLATLYNLCGPSTYAAIYRVPWALDGLDGATPKVTINSYSPCGLVLAMIAGAFQGAREVGVSWEPESRCHIASVRADEGERMIAINLSKYDSQLSCSQASFKINQINCMQYPPLRRFSVETVEPLSLAELKTVHNHTITCPAYSVCVIS